MGYRVLAASEAYWRPSNQMGVLNTDLAKQLEAETMGARLWRLRPGQASTRHRHRQTAELYVLLEGTGRLRVEDTLLTLTPLSSVLVDPETVRQPFNDTGEDQLWLVVGAPPEPANTLEMTDAETRSQARALVCPSSDDHRARPCSRPHRPSRRAEGARGRAASALALRCPDPGMTTSARVMNCYSARRREEGGEA